MILLFGFWLQMVCIMLELLPCSCRVYFFYPSPPKTFHLDMESFYPPMLDYKSVGFFFLKNVDFLYFSLWGFKSSNFWASFYCWYCCSPEWYPGLSCLPLGSYSDNFVENLNRIINICSTEDLLSLALFGGSFGSIKITIFFRRIFYSCSADVFQFLSSWRIRSVLGRLRVFFSWCFF